MSDPGRIPTEPQVPTRHFLGSLALSVLVTVVGVAVVVVLW